MKNVIALDTGSPKGKERHYLESAKLHCVPPFMTLNNSAWMLLTIDDPLQHQNTKYQ